MSKTVSITLDANGPCPCNSNMIMNTCCLHEGRFLRKKVPSLIPKGPITEYAHQNCYLSASKNCSQKLSAEHYLSHGILKELGPKISLKGAPWLNSGETLVLTPKNMTARILCERHNSSLSPLDAEAIIFFKKLREFQITTATKSLSLKKALYICSGESIELWMLKTICNIFFARIASSHGNVLIKSSQIDLKLVMNALYHGNWATSKCGLYIRAQIGQEFIETLEVLMAPLTSADASKQIVGIQMTLSGLEFMLLFDPRAIDDKRLTTEGWLFRPTEFAFPAQRRLFSLFLTWPPHIKSYTITFSPGKRTKKKSQ